MGKLRKILKVGCGALLVLTANVATATDYIVLEAFAVEVLPN